MKSTFYKGVDVVNTNLDTVLNLSKVLNIKSKSFYNALDFEESIRQRLRGSKKYQEQIARNIMKQELDKLKISDDDVQDNEATETNSSFDELISEFEDNIIF